MGGYAQQDAVPSTASDSSCQVQKQQAHLPTVPVMHVQRLKVKACRIVQFKTGPPKDAETVPYGPSVSTLLAHLLGVAKSFACCMSSYAIGAECKVDVYTIYRMKTNPLLLHNCCVSIQKPSRLPHNTTVDYSPEACTCS